MPKAFGPMRGWAEKIQNELAPSHGRYEGALRTASAVTIAAAILLALQIPMIAPGIYLIFLVSYDVPYLTFRRSVMELVTQCVGVGLALLLIQITGNDPMARVLGIAAFTFLSAFLLQACTARVMAMNTGIFPVLTLTLWEYHLPPKFLVYLSLAPIATGAIAVGCKVAIEYLFTHRDPHRALHLEMTARLNAMRTLFTLYGDGAAGSELKPAIAQVSRFAFAGQGKMLSLLKEIESELQHEDSAAPALPPSIPALVRMLDLAAAFGRQHPDGIDDAEKARAMQIVAGLEAIEKQPLATKQIDEGSLAERGAGLLGQFAQSLYNLNAIGSQAETRCQGQLRSPGEPPRQSWFKPDAWTNPEYLRFAFKLSFCATLCYIIYNALSWQGVSTATLTVLVAGLSTSGATNQKMFLRIIGALIGGVVFGIGCIVFVFPFADTLLPFLLLLGIVSFLAAWIARSAHLGYIGLQIAFSFYLTVFQEYAIPLGKMGEHMRINLAHKFVAPVVMTPGRDRVLGVLLALMVMWVVFHRIHPQRAVRKMRLALAQLLRVHAEVLPLFGRGVSERVARLREEAEGIVVEVRSLAEAIPYELDQHVERDIELSEAIQSAISSAGSLLLHTAAHSQLREAGLSPLPSTGSIEENMTTGLRNLAAMLEEGKPNGAASNAVQLDIDPENLEPMIPESSRSVIEAYCLLRRQCMAISAVSMD